MLFRSRAICNQAEAEAIALHTFGLLRYLDEDLIREGHPPYFSMPQRVNEVAELAGVFAVRKRNLDRGKRKIITRTHPRCHQLLLPLNLPPEAYLGREFSTPSVPDPRVKWLMS